VAVSAGLGGDDLRSLVRGTLDTTLHADPDEGGLGGPLPPTDCWLFVFGRGWPLAVMEKR